MNKLHTVAVVAALAVLLSATANALQQSPPQQTPTRLALEIVFLKGQPPSLYPVAGPQAKQSGGYSARFGRVAGWKLPDGVLPVRAVQVVSRLEGEQIKVWVAVLSGRESIEREEAVTSYDLQEGNKADVTELTRFGVEPIEIKVVRVRPHVVVIPRMVNRTESVIVTDIVANNSTLPSYKLLLQNLSNKGVAALMVEIFVGGKKEIIMMPQRVEGQPLIPSQGRYELSISAGYQVRPAYGDNPPDFSRDHDCVITAVVFNDGSYEGDLEPAARFRASISGRKIQIRRVLAALQEALSSKEEAAAPLPRLRAGLSALKTDVDEAEVKELTNEFTNLSASAKATLNSAMRASLSSIKKIVSEDLDRFERTQVDALSKPDFRSWLLASKEKYERWLANL